MKPGFHSTNPINGSVPLNSNFRYITIGNGYGKPEPVKGWYDTVYKKWFKVGCNEPQEVISYSDSRLLDENN